MQNCATIWGAKEGEVWMVIIKDLKSDETGWFTTGKFESKSFLPGEMNLMIFTDDGASLEDAQKCIEHFNNLADKPEILAAIEKRLEQFFLHMYDEWAAMGIYNDIVESLKPVMQDYNKGSKLSSFLSRPDLVVYQQQNGDIGYGIQTECPWEPEHQCLILIKNDECVYVGPSEMLDPWDDEEHLHCVGW